MSGLTIHRPATASPGWHPAKLVDATDIGVKTFGFGPKDQLRLDFELLDRTSPQTGRPLVVSGDYTKTLANKSNLTPIVKALLGASNLPASLHMPDLVGRQCELELDWNKKGTWMKILTARSLPQATPVVPAMQTSATPLVSTITAGATIQRLKKKFAPFETGPGIEPEELEEPAAAVEEP